MICKFNTIQSTTSLFAERCFDHGPLDWKFFVNRHRIIYYKYTNIYPRAEHIFLSKTYFGTYDSAPIFLAKLTFGLMHMSTFSNSPTETFKASICYVLSTWVFSRQSRSFFPNADRTISWILTDIAVRRYFSAFLTLLLWLWSGLRSERSTASALLYSSWISCVWSVKRI